MAEIERNRPSSKQKSSVAFAKDEAAKEDEPDNEQDVRASYASDGRWN